MTAVYYIMTEKNIVLSLFLFFDNSAICFDQTIDIRTSQRPVKKTISRLSALSPDHASMIRTEISFKSRFN